MPPKGTKRGRIEDEERPPVPSPSGNREQQARRLNPAGVASPRQPAPRQTPPPPSPTTQFSYMFLGVPPPLPILPPTPQTYLPMEVIVDRRRTMLEAQRQMEQERERQILAQLVPSNPSNPPIHPLQMGGASDFGVSRRHQSPDSGDLVPPPRLSRVQQQPSPLQLPQGAVDGLATRLSMLSPYRSPEGVFNFEDEYDYKSSSSGSGIHMKGGVLPVFRNMSMGRPADYYEQRDRAFAPWTKYYKNPVELANMDRIERLRFLVESDLARSKIKRPNFGKIKLG